jgi:CheY-like chemotaxis protein
MIREWADEDQREEIDEYLRPAGLSLAATWDDEEAWAMFESTMKAERQRG